MKEKKKISKKTKIIITTVIAIILILVIGIGLFINYHIQQLNIIKEESQNIANLQLINTDGSINKDAKINMEIKAKNEYGVIEETLKQYLNNGITLIQNAEEIYKESDIENILSIENIKNDGPDFVETKAKISTSKEDVETYMDQLINICDSKNMLTAIDDKQIGDYYKEIYKTIVLDDQTAKELENTKTKVENTKKATISAFDYLNKVIDFLSNNKTSWNVQNNQIMFNSQTKLNEFNKIMEEIPQM